MAASDSGTSPNAQSGTMRHYNAAVDLIERNLAERPHKIAYIDEQGSYSFAELGERVNRCANVLTGLGLAMETRVMVCLLDTIDFPAVFLGAIKAGLVPIAVNTLLTGSDFDFMLRDSRAQALVVSEASAGDFQADTGSPAVSQTCDCVRQQSGWLSAARRSHGERGDGMRRRADPPR